MGNLINDLQGLAGPVQNPDGFYHGQMQMNFLVVDNAPLINWHLGPDQNIQAGQRDLYSVLLHEAGHLLGIVSRFQANGTAMNGPVFNYYSRHDSFIHTADGLNALLTPAHGNLPMYAQIPVNGIGNLLQWDAICNDQTIPTPTYCNTAVCFMGLGPWTGVNLPTHNPGCHSVNSLSHYADQCAPRNSNPAGQHFVMAATSPPAPVGNPTLAIQRFFRAEEQQALCELGYATGTAFGETLWSNIATYTACAQPEIGGVHDGVNPLTWQYTLTTAPGQAIDLSGILANDHPGNAINVAGLEVIIGNGTQSNPGGFYPGPIAAGTIH